MVPLPPKAVSALRFGTAVHDLADLWVRLVFSQSLSLSLTSLRLGVSGESPRCETETPRLQSYTDWRSFWSAV